MYKIKEVKIDGFWHRLSAHCYFNDNVNIIIGRNGTGKTTFMNILHAVLSVDLDGLAENDFDNIEIKLVFGKKHKSIKVKKVEDIDSPFQYIEYQISSKKYDLRVVPQDDRKVPSHYRRRAVEESTELREELREIVSLSSLSVYRLRSGEDFEIKDRLGKRIISPVDYRLSQLKSALTQYQFELSQKARNISSTLQKDVLASILYSDTSAVEKQKIPKDFDKAKEKTKLASAYTHLGVMDSGIRKKIAYHISTIDKAVDDLYSDNHASTINFAALDAFTRTQSIIDLSLSADKTINEIYNQLNLFVSILKEFITDKIFSLESGELTVQNLNEEYIPINKLSSGEKQLLILLIETLLQKSEAYIYLTDEPELSLHIEWQRNIIPAVKKLNPSAQIIAATHSPEVASKYKDSLIDMKDVVNG